MRNISQPLFGIVTIIQQIQRRFPCRHQSERRRAVYTRGYDENRGASNMN